MNPVRSGRNVLLLIPEPRGAENDPAVDELALNTSNGLKLGLALFRLTDTEMRS
jgi:hypothetical protein